MKELFIKVMWPQVAIAVLFAVLAVLTLLSTRSERGSLLHRARLGVLAALVSLTVGSTTGCASRNNGPQPSDQNNQGATVDAGQQQQRVTPPDQPRCYMPVLPPDDQPPMPTCYEPVPVPVPPPPPDGQVQPPPEPPPIPTCYAPMVAPPPEGKDDSQGR